LLLGKPRGSELKHALDRFSSGTTKIVSGLPGHSLLVAAGPKLPTPSFPSEVRNLAEKAGQEGFAVGPAGRGHLAIAAKNEKGLANGLYQIRNQYSSWLDNPDCDRSRLTRPHLQQPAFPHRDSYHFLSPWRLQHLSMDSFTLEEWFAYLDWLRSLNANRVYIDLWANQYYHPEFPETEENKPMWERLYKVFTYARKIGLRTGIFFFPCQVPVSQWLAHPEDRAVEAENYHGIHLCWTRAKDKITPFDRFFLDYFQKVIDDVVVELEDPGACLCHACCDHFAEMTLEMVETYRNWRPNGNVDLCTLHFRDWIEAPGIFKSGAAHPVPKLREAVFKKLPRETMVIDADLSTLKMARNFGLDRGYFFFNLDPESGFEDQQVFPRPHLKEIENQVSVSLGRGDAAMQAYRMMPQAQFVTDYVLFRKCWDPSLATKGLLRELGSMLGLDDTGNTTFSEAMLALDSWWTGGALDELEECRDKLAGLRSVSQPLADLDDLVSVLTILGRYLTTHRSRVASNDFYPDRKLVNQICERVKNARIFQAYTIHQHWVNRSREILGQRIRWWLKGIAREIPTQNTIKNKKTR